MLERIGISGAAYGLNVFNRTVSGKFWGAESVGGPLVYSKDFKPGSNLNDLEFKYENEGKTVKPSIGTLVKLPFYSGSFSR